MFRVVLHPSVEVRMMLHGNVQEPVLPSSLDRINVRRGFGPAGRVAVYLILDIVVRRLDRDKRLSELRPDLRRPVIDAF
jgi:hypothetical protein